MEAQECLILSRNEVGQVLDGLEVRREAWGRTAEYFRTGFVDDEIEECVDLAEAESMEAIYASLIAKIRSQLMGTRRLNARP